MAMLLPEGRDGEGGVAAGCDVMHVVEFQQLRAGGTEGRTEPSMPLASHTGSPTMHRLTCLGLLAFVGSLSGCYVPPYRTSIQHTGAAGTKRDAEVTARARELPWESTYDVQIFESALPDGLQGADGGRRIEIKPGFEDRWEVLGEVESAFRYPDEWDLGWAAGFWTVPMHQQHSRERDTYCKVQAPLRAITLSLWNLVPFSWACFPKYPDNDLVHRQELKRAASAMGGDTVVLIDRGSRDQTRIASTGYVMVVYSVRKPNVSLRGIVLRNRTPTPAPAIESGTGSPSTAASSVSSPVPAAVLAEND
jgi:hypothetical protein